MLLSTATTHANHEEPGCREQKTEKRICSKISVPIFLTFLTCQQLIRSPSVEISHRTIGGLRGETESDVDEPRLRRRAILHALHAQQVRYLVSRSCCVRDVPVIFNSSIAVLISSSSSAQTLGLTG